MKAGASIGRVMPQGKMVLTKVVGVNMRRRRWFWMYFEENIQVLMMEGIYEKSERDDSVCEDFCQNK